MLDAAQTYDQGFRYDGYIRLMNPNIVSLTRVTIPVFHCVLTLLPHTYDDTYDTPPSSSHHVAAVPSDSLYGRTIGLRCSL